MNQLYNYKTLNSWKGYYSGLKLDGSDFVIYYRKVKSWYKGEDSGALYADEWSEDIPIEIYDLTPILDHIIIDGVTIKEHINNMHEKWQLFFRNDNITTGSLTKLYFYLDEIREIERLRKYRNPNFCCK